MKNYLTSLFLLFTFAGGVLAGTPVISGVAENGMSAMNCCKKKINDCGGAKTMSAAQICCVMNCSEHAPTGPSVAMLNFAPADTSISDSILKQIVALFKYEKPLQAVSYLFEQRNFPQKLQPKYIQNHSFLI